MARLSDPITILKGIGPARAKQFENLNIFTLEDLICHFPRGYEDRTQLVTIDKLQADVPACFKAMVMNSPRTAHVRAMQADRKVLPRPVSPENSRLPARSVKP